MYSQRAMPMYYVGKRKANTALRAPHFGRARLNGQAECAHLLVGMHPAGAPVEGPVVSEVRGLMRLAG
jgi:hypothetical protein